MQRDERNGRLGWLMLLAGCASGPQPASTEPEATAEAPREVRLAQDAQARLTGATAAIAYSGFRSGQHPDKGAGAVNPSDAEILEDLELLAATEFRLLRLYDAGELSASVLRLIHEHGLPFRVMQGAWLNAELSNHEGCAWLTEPIPEAELLANQSTNAEEVDRAIALAQKYPEIIVAVNVGNEALVDWNDHLVKVESLLAYARRVKAAIPQPVTTADNYVVWVKQGRRMMEVLDFAAVHTYPAWENKTIDEAMPYTIANLQAVRNALPDAKLVIGEAGWASVASEFGERASEGNQKRYLEELLAWARATNITTFVFEAFDEDWKGNDANPLGAEKHWGIFDIDRSPKLFLRERTAKP